LPSLAGNARNLRIFLPLFTANQYGTCSSRIRASPELCAQLDLRPPGDGVCPCSRSVIVISQHDRGKLGLRAERQRDRARGVRRQTTDWSHCRFIDQREQPPAQTDMPHHLSLGSGILHGVISPDSAACGGAQVSCGRSQRLEALAEFVRGRAEKAHRRHLRVLQETQAAAPTAHTASFRLLDE
jgi:hypothetical protein